MYTANKGFTQYVQAFIGLMIVAIIAISVTIPTIATAISTASLDANTLAVVNIVPLMVAVAVLMLVVSIIR